jgi:tetratricopeptide (TPR) repeat protein
MKYLLRLSLANLLLLLAAAATGAPAGNPGTPAVPPPESYDMLADDRSLSPAQDPESLIAACYEAALGDGDPQRCTQVLLLPGLEPMVRAAALNNRAILWGRQRQLDEALGDLNEAAQLDPGSPAIAVNQGNLLLRLDRFQDALRAYDDALRIAGTAYGPALYNRAFAYRALGDLASAAADLAAAQRLTGGVLERVPSNRTPVPAGSGTPDRL